MPGERPRPAGAETRIADVYRPLTAEGRWRTTFGAHLYLLAGHDTADQRVSGYVGISHSLTTGRPWVSLTPKVRTRRALNVDTIADTFERVVVGAEPPPTLLRRADRVPAGAAAPYGQGVTQGDPLVDPPPHLGERLVQSLAIPGTALVGFQVSPFR